MAEPTGNNGNSGAIREIDVLWVTAGLGCDGDTIAMTAATQPSIEDIVLGGIPWIPKVNFHNPFLSAANGDDFLRPFHQAVKGKLGPYILVIEGSVPDETNKPEGYWASMGTDEATGQPILTCDWIDRLAPGAWAVVAAGTCATYGGIHAMEGNPTGAMGLADYLGWQWKSKAGIPIVCVPGCPVQPDNMMETLLYLFYMAAGRAPMILARRTTASHMALRANRARRLRSRRLLRAGRVCRPVRFSAMHRQTGMLGTGCAVQRWEAGLDGRNWRLP